MAKKITTLEIRHSLGDILNRVSLREDQYIIQRKGKSLAAIVPVWQFEKWQNDKKVMFEAIDKVRARNKNVPPALLEKEVKEAVFKIRNK